jgi:fibronectin type 3 domain-containing protein
VSQRANTADNGAAGWVSSVAIPRIIVAPMSGTTTAFASIAYGATVKNTAAVKGQTPICVDSVSARISAGSAGT